MQTPKTYGQCLRTIMHNNQLSLHALSKKMGYRSTTQLSRILSDEVSPALITKFHHQFMLIFDWLISPAEIRALSTSLQYSCLGEEAFLTRRAMHAMLLQSPPTQPECVPVSMYPPCDLEPRTLSDLIHEAHRYAQIDMLVIGSAFDPLLPSFTALSKHDSLKLHIRHVFTMQDRPTQIVSRISMLLPFLSVNAYEGFFCMESDEPVSRFITEHEHMLIRAETHTGQCAAFVLLCAQGDGVSLCKLGDDTLFGFYEAQVDRFSDHLRPIKSIYSQPDTVENLLTLCQRDLFLEKERACCFVRLDLCFHALPTNIVLQATNGGNNLGLNADMPLLQTLCHVHDERYQNLLDKKQPTILVLSQTAMRAFMQTGHMSDHLFAMRDFTPEERRAILLPLIEAVGKNPNFHLHFFRDEHMSAIGCFSGYADMGVQISANHTAYNLEVDHSEVFIGMPAFAETYMTYCTDTLIPEYCLDQQESLDFLHQLLDEYAQSEDHPDSIRR